MTVSKSIHIDVILAEPKRCQKMALVLPLGTTARDALHHAIDAGLDVQPSAIDANTAPLGVYAQKVADDYIMQDDDRLEVYRSLRQDPMELRRQRAREDAKKRRP